MFNRSALVLTDRNLILTGYSEPNKPRLGRQVAERLKMPFVDVEERIQERMGDTIDTLRETFGDRHVKTIESSIMEEMVLHRNAVIRISGGILSHNDHFERMAETGPVICLVARLDAILQRMHLSMGARYHNPAERGAQLGVLRREWAIRKKTGIHELDVTDLDETGMILAIAEYWQHLAIARG
jgi:shikimate kinase